MNFESNENLRYILEEELHKIEHLERSNFELADAFKLVEDEDFKTAIEENNITLNKKRELVIQIHELLLKKDKSYRNEPYLERAGLARILSDYTVVQCQEVQQNQNDDATINTRAQEVIIESSSVSHVVLSGLYL